MGNNNQKGLWHCYQHYALRGREQAQLEAPNKSHGVGQSELLGKIQDQAQSKTHHPDDIFVQMCINDARRRWRWYTAVVQDTIAKRPDEKRWIKLLCRILDETRKTLSKFVKDTAEFNSRMGLSEGAASSTSGPHMLDSIYLYTQEAAPSHDDRIGEFQVVLWTSLPERILSELETTGRLYLWSESSMDSCTYVSRGANAHSRLIKKYQRKAKRERKAFDRMLKKTRDARLMQHENALSREGKLSSAPVQAAPPREEVRYELRLVGLRANEHPDDVVAQRVIDNAYRRWHWYTSLLKAMQSEHPEKIKQIQHLTRMVNETKQEYDSAVAATNAFNAQMGIRNVPAHDPTVHVLMFWNMLYEEHMNSLDGLRSQYSCLLVTADHVTVGNNRFRRLIRQAHERRAIFDDLLLRARRKRLRERTG